MRFFLITLLLLTFSSNAQQLQNNNIDWYLGTRLEPVDTTLNGFHIEKSTNTALGFSVINTDNTGNASQANIFVKGTGANYTNYTGLSHYNNGYYVSWLRNSGLLFSDSKLNIGTWNNNAIEFRTGNAFTTMTAKMRIEANGLITLLNVPTYLNDTDAGNGGLTQGQVYKLSDGTLKIKL